MIMTSKSTYKQEIINLRTKVNGLETTVAYLDDELQKIKRLLNKPKEEPVTTMGGYMTMKGPSTLAPTSTPLNVNDIMSQNRDTISRFGSTF